MWNLQLPYYSPLLTGTRNANKLRKGWPKAVSAAGLTLDGRGKKILTPKISNITILSDDGNQITASVDMSTVGKTSRDLSSRIETVTASLHAYQTRVERQSPAIARITVSFSPPRHSPTYDQSTNNTDLEDFTVPLDQTSSEAAISLTTSLLIGGASESGKSNLVWYLLSQLNQLSVPYRLHIIDPAGGVELSDLEHSPLTRQYVDRIGDISKIVSSFRKSMDDRLASMKGRGVRRHHPTIEEPLEIMIIDELLLTKAQLGNGDAASPIGEVLASGRKALHVVWGCSQLGQVDVLGRIRDLFPQRICLRTRTNDMTDAILGTNATSDGANCHRITLKGEGYVFTDHSGVFEKFRTPLVRETAAIAAGGTTLPTTPPPSTRREQLRRRRAGRHFTYLLYDQNDPHHPHFMRPCYVGITDNPRRRLREHERGPNAFPTAVWKSIIHSRTKITAYPNWDAAKQKETELINYYHPKYNVQERAH